MFLGYLKYWNIYNRAPIVQIIRKNCPILIIYTTNQMLTQEKCDMWRFASLECHQAKQFIIKLIK